MPAGWTTTSTLSHPSSAARAAWASTTEISAASPLSIQPRKRAPPSRSSAACRPVQPSRCYQRRNGKARLLSPSSPVRRPAASRRWPSHWPSADGVVINADSAQIYRDLPILSAAPTAEEQDQAEHRLTECAMATCPARLPIMELAKEEIREPMNSAGRPYWSAARAFICAHCSTALRPSRRSIRTCAGRCAVARSRKTGWSLSASIRKLPRA